MHRQGARQWLPEYRSTLIGKRVMVVGHGAVGAAVADRLSVFRCEVVLVARTGRTAPTGLVHGVMELPKLLPTVDAVVLCAPLTEHTRCMFGADTREASEGRSPGGERRPRGTPGHRRRSQ
ncbi:NAD(P)-dependent oxidoreductase [Streptomyces sp. 3212.3]|uniref:NAD(P)-dependent oxidoreductase n=1 Tax=Streptomyces sp. 3212.3 TaxID=1938846 RepID=UPI002B414F3E|nr:NAD(P)-dependent oxidoreductase [Streptomyces sp. 3212.3]